MGYYRPRPIEVKGCAHCGLSFQTNHKRAIYCGSSCRTLAYRSRHGHETTSVKGDLNFSFQNVATVAVGSGVASLGNHLLHTGPAHDELLGKLVMLQKEQIKLRADMRKLIKDLQPTTDYIQVQIDQNPTVRAGMTLELAKRNLQLAQERGDLPMIEKFNQQILLAQKGSEPGR